MGDLREWAPLTDLFGCLPLRVQSGLFPVYVKLTCVDVVSDFIALGSNTGVLYWYDRKKKVIQKLKGEDLSSEITIVKIVSTVDYMVACGCANGKVSIFQVPKEHARDLPEQVLPKQEQQVERYTVGDMHKTTVTALEWSRNGTKLFSGDKSGQVVLTNVNFSMHIITSRYILNEASPVVQLSYNTQGLLVSTKYRSIISKAEDWKTVTQIGTKDRKVLDKFGGVFYQKSPNPKDVISYCSRPGLRLWISNLTGEVQKTLKFKDILENSFKMSDCEVQLINPISKHLKQSRTRETSFGVLMPYNDLLVTHNNDVLYVLDPNPNGPTAKAIVSNLRQIVSVAICTKRKEIFILEGDRSLIRIAENPEDLLEPKVNKAASIQPTVTKTPSGNDLTVHTDTTIVTNAEEAVESTSLNEKVKKLKAYDEISHQDFDDNILYKPRSHKRGSCTTASSASSDAESHSSRSVFMNVSMYGFKPDLRSREAIVKDIEEKEKLLANILCFDKVKVIKNNKEIAISDDTDGRTQQMQSSHKNSESTGVKGDWMQRSLNLDAKCTDKIPKRNGSLNLIKPQLNYGLGIGNENIASGIETTNLDHVHSLGGIKGNCMHMSLNLDSQSLDRESERNGSVDLSKFKIINHSLSIPNENVAFDTTTKNLEKVEAPVVHSIPTTWNVKELNLDKKHQELKSSTLSEQNNPTPIRQNASVVKKFTTSSLQTLLTSIKNIPQLRMTQSCTEPDTKPRRKSSTDDDDWVIVGGNFTV